MKRALFIGRFQPFHKGHLHVAKSLSKKYDELIIGIGSSQEKNTKNNPFSYNERKTMISKTLQSNKIKNFKIYPIPDLYDDAKWTNYILKNLPKFDIAYSGNEWTIRCFKKHKLKAQKIRLVNGISSTKIRGMIICNKNWKDLVANQVADYIKKIKGTERAINIYSKNNK
mgnify:CR=1 FL=1